MDDALDPELKDVEHEEEIDGDFDLGTGLKKAKTVKDDDDDSLDALAEEEDATLPEDAFDDQDLW